MNKLELILVVLRIKGGLAWIFNSIWLNVEMLCTCAYSQLYENHVKF